MVVSSVIDFKNPGWQFSGVFFPDKSKILKENSSDVSIYFHLL